MTVTRRAFASGLCLLAVLPGGCASPTPVLYTLDAVPGPVLSGGPAVVVLQDIGLAPYLDRQQIVRSSSDYRIDVETNNWWGESFTAMIGRVLAAEIDQRLPGTDVFGESGAVSATPDATVAVNITRFDLDMSGHVVLTAQVGVEFARSGRRDVTSGLRFAVPTASPDVTGQVVAMSKALGELADAIAGDLVRRAGAQPPP
jgi:uncharacterized lipoprotein YmbA